MMKIQWIILKSGKVKKISPKDQPLSNGQTKYSSDSHWWLFLLQLAMCCKYPRLSKKKWSCIGNIGCIGEWQATAGSMPIGECKHLRRSFQWKNNIIPAS